MMNDRAGQMTDKSRRLAMQVNDKMVEALLPCPFCGGRAEIFHIEEGENAGGSCVCCTRCMASGNVEFEFKENFIGNWNRRAALAHREAEAVQVKPLEWTHLPDAFPPMWITKTAIGSYHIEEAAGSDSPSFDLFNPMAGPMGNYEGLDEAKAAAQADYEHRIRSALVAPLEVDGSGRTLDGKWVLVPVEPTVAMSAAGMRYIKSVQTDHFQKYAGGIANSIYEKMLTAAQEGR